MKSRKLLLLMTLAAVFVGGGMNFMAMSAMTDQSAKVQKLRGDTHDKKQIQQELDDSEKKLEECSGKLKHLEEGVPDTAYIPTMLSELEKTGRESGIEVTGVRPLPPPPKPQKKEGSDAKPERKPYEEIDIEVKGKGNYAAAMKFVDALQSFPKIVAARMVTLIPKPEAQAKGLDTLDVTVVLRAYMFSVKPQTKDLTGASK